MATTFYTRLQSIALLPVAAFVWTGMADASLGWSSALPMRVYWDEPGRAAWIVCATGVEVIVPFGLLFRQTRATAALALSAYVLLSGLSAYAGLGAGAHLQVQPFLRTVAVAGALLFVFAATRSLVDRGDRGH